MKSSLLILILTLLGCASQPYHRFWRGEKRPDLSNDQFLLRLNHEFIPNTLKAGSGHLIAYQPAITLGMFPNFPDEIALVTYHSQKEYQKLVASETGGRYQKSHWEYFNQKSSGSVVPEPFLGKIEWDHAYDFFPSFTDWSNHSSLIVIHKNKAKTSSEDDLDNLRSFFESETKRAHTLKIQGHVVLITSLYWIEYLSFKTEDARTAALPLLLSEYSKIPNFELKIIKSEIRDLKKPLMTGQALNYEAKRI